MKKAAHKIIMFTGLPRQSWYWVAAGVLISLLIHLISIHEIPGNLRNPMMGNAGTQSKKQQVKVNIVKKPKIEKEKIADAQRIIETPMAPTEAPKLPSRLGAQDHAVEKETRVSNNLPRPKAADPGQAGRDIKSEKERKASQAPQPLTMTPDRVAPKVDSGKQVLVSPDGTVVVPSGKPDRKPRNAYESLMPNAKEMSNQIAAGYQDFVDDEIDVGERVDMNTTSFRFIGYFTNIRKAFELVWIYPSEAVGRGLQGEVKVEFTILKSGVVSRIKIVETSGHRILDDAVVEALKLAQPFAPLPDGLKKDKLTVVGSFRYVLTTYAGAL